MKLAYLVSQYPAIHHTFIFREILFLRDSGCDLTAISIRLPDRDISKLSGTEREEALRTRYVKSAFPWRAAIAHLRTMLRRPSGYLAGLFAALQLGRAQPYDTFASLAYFAQAVVAGDWMIRADIRHFHSHFTSTVGYLLTRIFPISMSATFHGPDEFTEPTRFHLGRKMAACRFAITISSYGRSQIMRFGSRADWSRIFVCRLGVNPADFSPTSFRYRPEPFVIATTGRLVPVKAVAVLIEATVLLARAGWNIRLHVVGDGPEREALQRQAALAGIEDRIVFEGWLDQDAIRQLYQKVDLFAMASFAEGIPVVLMEAMAMEIPCVATYVGGIPELIRSGESGMLATASDSAALGEAISALLKDSEFRKKVGRAGRQRILTDYDLTRNGAALVRLFTEQLGL